MYKTRDTKNQVQIKILKIVGSVSCYIIIFLNCQCVKKKMIEILFKSKTLKKMDNDEDLIFQEILEIEVDDIMYSVQTFQMSLKEMFEEEK